MAHKYSYRERYPLNRGDFYVENGSCTACGAPQAEASTLIVHSREDNHCYFLKQPETEIEIDKAIGAMMVSCVNALRYGGTDERILKRLYENGMAELCDHESQQFYPIVIRNKVDFSYAGTLREIIQDFTKYLIALSKHAVILDEIIFPAGQFRFIHRWDVQHQGSVYEGNQRAHQEFTIIVRGEQGKDDSSVGRICLLYDFLQQESRASHFQWKSLDPENIEIYEKPF